jgi:hypothetical protein
MKKYPPNNVLTHFISSGITKSNAASENTTEYKNISHPENTREFLLTFLANITAAIQKIINPIKFLIIKNRKLSQLPIICSFPIHSAQFFAPKQSTMKLASIKIPNPAPPAEVFFNLPIHAPLDAITIADHVISPAPSEAK